MAFDGKDGLVLQNLSGMIILFPENLMGIHIPAVCKISVRDEHLVGIRERIKGVDFFFRGGGHELDDEKIGIINALLSLVPFFPGLFEALIMHKGSNPYLRIPLLPPDARRAVSNISRRDAEHMCLGRG